MIKTFALFATVFLAASLFYIIDPFSLRAAAGDTIILWDGASIPSGWTCVSCASGDPFFQAFPRGSATYGSATSSANTHTAQLTFASHTQGESLGISNTGTTRNTAAHTHPVAALAVGSGDHTPLFRGLKLIRAATTTLPQGAIGIFDTSSSTLPVSWTYYDAMEGRYLRAENSSSTGGSATHSHSVSATANASANTAGGAFTSGDTQLSVASASHTHTISGTTPTSDNSPPYADVVFGKLSATSSVPGGMIAMFDATPPTGWTTISGAASSLSGRFLRGAETYGGTGGSETHAHTTTTVTSTGPSVSALTRNGANQVASGAHTHNFSFTSATDTSLPTYRDVIFAKKNEVSPQFTQRSFRFYSNADSLSPGAARNSENAAVTQVNQGEGLRLRMGVLVQDSSISTSTQSFRLYFAPKESAASCADVGGGLYTEVGVPNSGAIWRGVNMGGNANDGDALPSMLLALSTVKGTYEESNPSTANPFAIPEGETVEYDWAIESNGATSNASYCFRMVKSSGLALESYAQLPEVQMSQFGGSPPPSANTNISAVTTEHWGWNDLIGWIDFYNTDTVKVLSAQLTGYASSSAGDISLDCATTRSGNICGTSNYGVTNDGGGYLSGWGWNDTYGWISFDCNNNNGCGASNYRTRIDPDSGVFYNYAWNDIIGWISLNCNCAVGNPAYYLTKTSWFATSTSGTLESSIFDTGVAAGAKLNSILWRGSQPAGTGVLFQLAVSNSTGGPWTFVGTDGTSGTSFSTGPDAALRLPVDLFTDYRYFRYKTTLISNQAQTATPRVDEVLVNWSP